MSDSLISLNLWQYGVLSYLFCHLLHLLVWRSSGIEPGVRLLFTLLVGVPVLIYLNLLLKFGVAWIAPALIHFLLAANYIAIYPAFQASSPTIRILAFLWKTKRTMGERELVSQFGTQDLMGKRVEDLTLSGLVRAENGALLLSAKAKLLAGFFVFYRRLLGLPRGEG